MTTPATARPTTARLAAAAAVLSIVTITGCGGAAGPGALATVSLGPDNPTPAVSWSTVSTSSMSPTPEASATAFETSAEPQPASSGSPSTPPPEAPRPPPPDPPATSPCVQPLAPGDVVWIDTPVFVHDKDFHPLSDWVNPAVGPDWLAPVDYANGEVTVCIELISVADPSVVPIYYLIGWGPGDGSSAYVRGGAMFEGPSGVVKERVPVKQFQRVENGYDVGNVGDSWNWAQAVDSPNGDTWGNGPPYPLTVRLRLTLHPRSG